MKDTLFGIILYIVGVIFITLAIKKIDNLSRSEYELLDWAKAGIIRDEDFFQFRELEDAFDFMEKGDNIIIAPGEHILTPEIEIENKAGVKLNR